MVTHLQTQGGDIPVLNSNQESKKVLQRAKEVRNTAAQLPAPVSNGQPEEDPQKATEARNTKAEPSEPVPVLVKEHALLLQASNDNQLGF